ncbi:MAG: MaoC family dehydratase [Pseudomonadales bacterium]|nr:MaoC family dehydratase [Pseudomonadales bacterium]
MTKAPWFEDFKVGDDYSQVPAVTITEGHVAIHQAIFGDRLRMTLDNNLSKKITGHDKPLVNPSLVCNLAIGQTTIPSQRVMGNLFYRGLILRHPVYVGDTLTTNTKVVALRQNKLKPGRAGSGMVALEIHVKNQNGDTVLLFWRCPMIPCQDPEADTGHADAFDMMPEDLDPQALKDAMPDWQYATYKELSAGEHFDQLIVGDKIVIEAQDTVSLAPELVRMTLNLAMTHTDATRSVYGKRLVYGGHTIAIAAAQLTRELPNLMTILGWHKCDHVAPVFEQDILRSEVTLTEKIPFKGSGIANFHVETFATRGGEAPQAGENVKVLDWHLAALFAK